MKTAGELAKKYEKWALEQKAKREREQGLDTKSPEDLRAELLAKMRIKR